MQTHVQKCNLKRALLKSPTKSLKTIQNRWNKTNHNHPGLLGQGDRDREHRKKYWTNVDADNSGGD